MFELNDLPPEFSDVEKMNGVPLIICRWGVKKVRLDGKIFLAAMSSSEGGAGGGTLRTLPGQSVIEDLSASSPHCLTISGYCHPQGGCKKCKMKTTGQNEFKCDCVAT
jgi:hypothetical protein